MPTFDELVASRKEWIEQELKPWCLQSDLSQLELAALQWGDIAGKADPDKTLWAWAWSRFPVLVHQQLGGIDESSAVSITLKDGRSFTGYPDARRSKQGRLLLSSRSDGGNHSFEDLGPFSIDEIESIQRADT